MKTIFLIVYSITSLLFISYLVYQWYRNNKVYNIRCKWIKNNEIERHNKYTYDAQMKRTMNETITLGIIMNVICWIAAALFLFAGKSVPPPIILCNIIFPIITIILTIKHNGNNI